VIRTIAMLAFWGVALPFAGLIFIPWTFLSGDISLMYRVFMWGALAGVRLAGVQVHVTGREKIIAGHTYIFMSNHVSNIDPPLMIPLIPIRTSIMMKKSLFRIPLLGRAMRMASMLPVDRANRDAGIAAVEAAREVVVQGISMTIFVEGKRSFDGKMLPFKKGPFYLAMDAQVPVVPVTISGTHYVMPKRRFAIKPGRVDVSFHDPIDPAEFVSRECLMGKVFMVINSGLPPEYQQAEIFTTEDTEEHRRTKD
jgi:1-acyl-sn-glycerol-3-phosphate acyltransferase